MQVKQQKCVHVMACDGVATLWYLRLIAGTSTAFFALAVCTSLSIVLRVQRHVVPSCMLQNCVADQSMALLNLPTMAADRLCGRGALFSWQKCAFRCCGLRVAAEVCLQYSAFLCTHSVVSEFVFLPVFGVHAHVV